MSFTNKACLCGFDINVHSVLGFPASVGAAKCACAVTVTAGWSSHSDTAPGVVSKFSAFFYVHFGFASDYFSKLNT